MPERTSHPHGTFSWIDLATTDPDAGKAFYAGLFGWAFEDMPTGEEAGDYSMASLGGLTVAGLYLTGGSMGPPHWNSYVTVDHVDALAPAVSEAGGQVAMEPFDVLDVGRMLLLQDPTGAFLALWEPRGHVGAQRVNEPGCLTWNDLLTTDAEAARTFYGRVLGWTFEEMAPGRYWVIRNGDRSNGGIRLLADEERSAGIPSHWLPYFAVEDAGAALERVTELGGTALAGPMQVTDVGRFGIARDPQHAVFAVYSGTFDD